MLSFLRIWKGLGRNAAKVPDPSTDFRALAENSLDLIVRCDSNRIASYASPAIVRMLGIEPNELIGKSHIDFVVPEDLPVLREVFARHNAGQTDGLATFRMVRKDGTIIWVEGRGHMVEGARPDRPDFVVTMRDVTERKLLEAKLAALALTDGLTGLANRRAFDDALEREWRRTMREGTVMSVLLLDVDWFKAFNDHYGHQMGDECLRAVSAALGQTIRRPGDMAARYGGEEFAMILANTDAAGALMVAEAMRTAVQALRIPHEKAKGDGAFVSVSIGCATALSRAGASTQMPAGLLRAADCALYKAKAAGRNNVKTALMTTNQSNGQSRSAA